MGCKVKICGITNLADRDYSAKSGADYCGVIVEVPASPRHRSLDEARALFAQAPAPMVAVSVNRSLEEYIETAEALAPFALQLHGTETPAFVGELAGRVDCELWKAIHLPASESGEDIDRDRLWVMIEEYAQAGAAKLLADATVKLHGKTQMGGTGKTVDWNLAAEIVARSSVPVIVAGGLKPENAAEAARIATPHSLDVSSGVEMAKGKKDLDKVLAFIMNVKQKCDRTARNA